MSLILVKDFFKPIKLTDPPRLEDYKKVKDYIAAAEAFSQITYQSVYIIDYYKRGFLYVSDNPLFLCGKSPKQVLNAGYFFYLKNVPQKDLELLLKINEAGFKFYSGIPVEDRLKYTISYDFHLIQPNKRLLLINHKLTPFVLDKDHNIWLALCIVSGSSNSKAGNITIRRRGSGQDFEYDLSHEKWVTNSPVKINVREKEILLLSAQGYTMDEIAGEINVSVDTVKFHKKKLFKRFQVKNITEAMAFASGNKII